MYVTYFEGSDDLPPDLETRDLWKKHLPEDHILGGSLKDNFWKMGDVGICGACTEVHYDLIGNRFCPELVNNDSSVVEIWNNVFMEYNRDDNGYHKLDGIKLDCGVGLERLTMIMQNKTNIYQTDAFRYLIGYCQILTNAEFYTDDSTKMSDRAYRIFADHIRTVALALFDGVTFGFNDREYVIRKVFRRMLTYMYLYLLNGKVSPMFDKPVVKLIISDVLNYFGKRKHDAEAIWKQMVDEEKLFIGKITHAKLLVDNAFKKSEDKEAIFKDLHESKGMPIEILENVDKLSFI
jgi:alanyl-tRNA synthetase